MMRINLTLCLVAVLMATGAARAEFAHMSGAYGQADIERACRSAGGTSTGIAGVSYGCEKKNCDGKGGTCSVQCTDPLSCWATTPSRIVVPTTLLGLLQNGNRGLRTPRAGVKAPDSLSTKPLPRPTEPAPNGGTLY